MHQNMHMASSEGFMEDEKSTPAEPSEGEVDETVGPLSVNLGTYSCKFVTNIPLTSEEDDTSNPRTYFDRGLRHFFAYQHEEAYKCFLACLTLAPDCAFAHGMVALTHSPNYNFKGGAYYDSENHADDEEGIHAVAAAEAREGGGTTDPALMRQPFPSQQVASRHALLAVEKVEELRRRQRGQAQEGTPLGGRFAGRKNRRGKNRRGSAGSSRRRDVPEGGNDGDSAAGPPLGQPISDIETQILSAIRILTYHPGIHPDVAEETVGRPYSDALRKVYERFPTDAEASYFFAESLMVRNAWNLYKYPTGRPVSGDVAEIQRVLEEALVLHPHHAGICHLYVHLCEMSSYPEKALPACRALRTHFPDAGHLIHMPTHIDVLLGDYESCVRWNYTAIIADERIMSISFDTAGTESFYFGYIVHNFHMLVYGAILGGMEGVAMEISQKLNGYLREDVFVENPDLTAYLESYAALDVHTMIRFGRWKNILQTELPRYPILMLYRSASLHYARGLALANLGEPDLAEAEADLFDDLRCNESSQLRILHNNTVADLLAVDAPTLRGEIAYKRGNYEEGFALLRKAVALQDGLNFDEPWGKMQPIRHPLGGLLCEQGWYEEAEEVFRVDLKLHPGNPWGLVGLINCIKGRLRVVEGVGERSSIGCCSEGAAAGDKYRTDGLEKLKPLRIPISDEEREGMHSEIKRLEHSLAEQRKSMWVDFDISTPCACVKETAS